VLTCAWTMILSGCSLWSNFLYHVHNIRDISQEMSCCTIPNGGTRLARRAARRERRVARGMPAFWLEAACLQRYSTPPPPEGMDGAEIIRAHHLHYIATPDQMIPTKKSPAVVLHRYMLWTQQQIRYLTV